MTRDKVPKVDAAQDQDPQLNAKHTVLLLASRLGMGGAERHTITLANLLSRRFRVVVAYLKPEEEMLDLLDREHLLELRSLHAKSKIDMRAAGELAELAERHGARLVVCANAFALMYAHLARLKTSQPLIVMEVFHTTKLRTLKEHLALLFYRPFFWAAHHVVFVCQAQRDYWRRRGLWGRRTHMIYNGVDVSHFDPARYEQDVVRARSSLGFGIDDHVVGICAVLRPEKAHTDLLAAVARLRRQGQRWRVLIIGDGPLRGRIEQEASKLGVSDDVVITGFVSDVRPSLSCCDVIALVSTSESFSIAALEAMAMGKPMIMSDIGGAREQVRNGTNGLLFPAGDVVALATCLHQMWDKTEARRMGAAARNRVERDFSLQTMSDCYVNLFQGIYDSLGCGMGKVRT